MGPRVGVQHLGSGDFPQTRDAMTNPLDLPLVAFDETGNTGQHLLDPHQPVFALASVCVDPEMARDVLAGIIPSGAAEAKFSSLRSNRAGQARIIALLNGAWVDERTVKGVAYHKPFMVTTKIVDMLFETVVHARGIDLYENGGNLATANLLHATTDAFCGAGALDQLHHRFVAMVRCTNPETVEAFYDYVDTLIAVSDEDGRVVYGIIAASRGVLDVVLRPGDVTAMDPAVPCFVDLLAQWTATLQVPFAVAHDASKPIAAARAQLELLMSMAEIGQEMGGPGPKRQLPLLSTGVTFADSRTVPAIQLADIVAGSLATVFRASLRDGENPFVAALRETRLTEIGFDCVWPTLAVTPEELGTGRSAASLNFSIALSEREQARRAR